MAGSARTISVVVSGDSGELTASIEKALAAINKLGEQTAKQSTAGIAQNRKTIESNAQVGSSYSALAAEAEMYAKRSYSTMATANARMVAAQREYGAQMAETVRAATAVTLENEKAYQSAALSETQMFKQRQLAATAAANDKMMAEQDSLAEFSLTSQRDQHAAMLEDQAAYGARAAAEQEATTSRMVSIVTAGNERLIAEQRAYESELDASQARVAARQDESAAKVDAARAATGAGLVSFGKKASLGLLGVAAASTYMAAKFQENTLRLQTQAGATHAELEKMREGALRMAGSLGATPEAFQSGLYHVASSMEKILPPGNKVNEMLHITEVALKGAAIGGTNAEETTYALTSALNALHLKGSDATKTMGELNAIVGSGDMTMNDLLAALKSGLIPTASQFGVSLQSLGGALAVMGDMGMRGAQAGTRLRMSLALLGGPSKKAAEILQSIGLSGEEVHAKTKAMTEAIDKSGVSTTKLAGDLKKPDGLGVALKDLHEHLIDSGVGAETAAAIMVRAFGGGRMAATIDLLEQNVGRTGTKFHQIGEQAGQFGHDWEEVQKTTAFQFKELEGNVETLGIKIGNKLLPKMNELMGTIKEIGDYLGTHKQLADAAYVALGGAAVIGVGAYGASKVAKVAGGIKTATKALGIGTKTLEAVRGDTPATPLYTWQVNNMPKPGPNVPPGAATDVGAGAGTAGAADAAASSRIATAGGGLAAAAGIAVILKAFAAGGAPGVVQTPANVVNAQAHDLGHTLEDVLTAKGLLKAVGVKTPSITDALLPGVDHLGFDPMKEPQKAVEYILTGKKPISQISTAPNKNERKYATRPGMGHPQATPAGVNPHDEPNRHEKPLSEKGNQPAYAKAAHELMKANAELAPLQQRVNELVKEGKMGTPEYAKAIEKLTAAQRLQKEAQAEVAKTQPELQKAWEKTPNAINIAAKAYASFPEIVKRYLHEAKAGVTSELTAIGTNAGAISLQTVSKIVGEYNKLPPELKKKLDDAGGAVKIGLDKINKETAIELKVLGVAGGITTNLTTALKGFGAARGGLMQLGQPGQPGHDSIPMSVGGTNIVAAPGEQVAVFTRHQQADVAKKIPGGLPSVFANKKPNYMATGGPVGGWKNVIASAEVMGGDGYKGNPIQARGYSELSVPPSVPNAGSALGHLPYQTRMRIRAGSREVVAQKQDIGAGSSFNPVMGLYPGTQADLGLSGGEYHVSIERADGAPLTAGASQAVAAAVKKLVAPAWTGPGGAIGAIGKGALSKVVGGANALLSKEAAAHAPAGGGAGNLTAGGVSGPSGVGTFGGITVADWIIPELNYGRAHGWHGPITSGVRYGFDPHAPSGSEHALIQYPGGAVDFGGMVDPAAAANRAAFEAAVVGYTGKRLIKATGFRDDGHMSGTGHSMGGFVNAAMGYVTGGSPTATAAKKKKQNNKPIPKGKGHRPTHHKLTKATIAQALAPLSIIPDTENLPPKYAEGEKQLNALTNQATMLQALETSKADTFILPGDMNYIGAMEKYAKVNGMSTPDALAANLAAVNKNKLAAKGKPNVSQEEEAEALAYQGEYINWAAEQPSHKQITSSDLAILGGADALAGWSPKKGDSLWHAELMNLLFQEGQLSWNERYAEGGISIVGAAIAERKTRESLVDAVMQKEKYRLSLTEGHIEHLTTGSLKNKIAHAKSTQAYQERVTAGQESAAVIQEAIDHEHQAAKPDKKHIASLTKQKHEALASSKTGKPATGKVGQAQVTLLEHILKGQVPPIHEALSQLGGKANQVSHSGGKYHSLDSEVKTLKKSGTSVFDQAIEKISGTDMPTTQLAVRALEEAKDGSPVPIFFPAEHEPEKGANAEALLQLQTELTKQANERASISGIELAAIKTFMPQIPHYEQGGPVVDTGLAMVHKGEHVVPVGGSLVSNSAPNVSLNHQTVVQGDMAALIKVVDSRITHPDNVRAVSSVMAQRTQLFSGRG
jgi:TP901 family phage tail tape measure protein